MPLPRTRPQHKTKNETKYPMLNRIFNNIERYKQTSCASVNLNMAGTKCTLASREPQLKAAINHKLMRKPEDFLTQFNARLPNAPKITGKHKSFFAHYEIDSVYEKLQRKYCPKFSLGNKSNKNDQTNKSVRKVKQKPKKNPQKPVTNSPAKMEQTKQNKSIFVEGQKKPIKKKVGTFKPRIKTHDSDTTLVPAQKCDKESTVRHTTGDNNCNKATITKQPDLKLDKQEIPYPQIQQLFYDQPIPISETINYSEDYLEREIKKAIILGKSANIADNKLLADAIQEALKMKFPLTTIKSILNNIKHFNSKQKVLHLVQIQLGRNVFILCTVRTCNFCNLLLTLDKIMKPLGAKFAPVLQHFTHCCVIEATVPATFLQLNTKQLRRHLDWHAEALKLKQIALIDESSGEVSVQCLPVSMPHVTQALESKGYKILTSDYGFRATNAIVLDTSTGLTYRQLINNLLGVEDIETISDNVIY